MTPLVPPLPALMGVLNVTPDSFSDRAAHVDPAAAIAHGTRMCIEGAAIIDVGGQASGPGSTLCDTEEELRRVLPVVNALAPTMHLSVDTFRSGVARAVLAAGARTINDISGLRHDPEMRAAVRDHEASIVIMFSKECPEYPLVTEKPGMYDDVVLHIGDFLAAQADAALNAGISASRIILDPGMGRFVGTDEKYSWEIIQRLPELRARFRDFRLLIGVSRKGFLGGAVHERDPISQLVGLAAAECGVDIIRTHNIAMAKRFLEVWNRISVPMAPG